MSFITERGDPRDRIANQLPIRHRRMKMRAETIELVEESEGYELVVETETDRFVFNVHGVLDDLTKIAATIADYYAEGRKLAREHERDLAMQPEEE